MYICIYIYVYICICRHNRHGQLGTGDKLDRSTPVHIPLPGTT